jgi:hypothetical protein
MMFPRQPRDIESFWEYSDPAASEQRFRAALAAATGDERLELLTQVARTYSLRKDFAAAHRQLDAIEKELPGAGPGRGSATSSSVVARSTRPATRRMRARSSSKRGRSPAPLARKASRSMRRT